MNNNVQRAWPSCLALLQSSSSSSNSCLAPVTNPPAHVFILWRNMRPFSPFRKNAPLRDEGTGWRVGSRKRRRKCLPALQDKIAKQTILVLILIVQERETGRNYFIERGKDPLLFEISRLTRVNVAGCVEKCALCLS